MKARLESIQAKIHEALKRAHRPGPPPRLVAVSKFKGCDEIMEAYNLGLRVFGENRIDELKDKSLQLPKDIQWHFIGTIQSNKISTLLSVPNLSVIESIDSIDHAAKLFERLRTDYPGRSLKIFLQVNTSQEASKHGFGPANLIEIVNRFQHEFRGVLEVCGLMTIGSLQHSLHTTDNPDFQCLLELKQRVEVVSGLHLELSMGMSADYELAVHFHKASHCFRNNHIDAHILLSIGRNG